MSQGPRLNRPISGSDAEQARRVLEVAKIVSATIGKDFFRSLVGHLASMLGGDCVYIAELVDSPVPKLRTIAVFLDGAPGSSFEQDVSGCAGGQALSDGVFAWSKDARRLFPSDPVLARFDAEGYVGVGLTDSAGQVIGLT